MWPQRAPLPQGAKAAWLQGEAVLGRSWLEAGGDCGKSLRPGRGLGEGSGPQDRAGASPGTPLQHQLAGASTSTGHPVPSKPCSSILNPW